MEISLLLKQKNFKEKSAIDNGIIMLALYQVFGADSHVVTQVVETEFVVRTERDVCQVCLTACVGVRLMTVDTIYAQSVEHIKRSHPFGVTFGEVIIHGNHVHTVSGQCVKEYREVATNVLPSPVAISAILPLCRTTPPKSCTS